MTTNRVTALVAGLVLAFGLALAAPATAQTTSPCPAGQPTGNPPGQTTGGTTGRPDNYPPGECALRLSRSSAVQGTSLTASGSGFAPNCPVTLVLRPDGTVLETVNAGSDGAFTTSVTIPGNATVGQSTIAADCAGRELTAGLEVLAASATRGGTGAAGSGTAGASTARTGAEIAASALLGVVLIAIGATLLIAVRRRRRPGAATA